MAVDSCYDADNGPVTRSKPRVKRSAHKTVPSPSSGRKDYGLPTTQDRQGKNLFTRPSDGKMVYLYCCVPGCEKANFPNALALRNHVCSPGGLHKIKGLFTSNTQAIEVCGRFTSSQEIPLTTETNQPFGAAAIANTTRGGVLSLSPNDLNEYHLRSKESSLSSSDTGAHHSATLSKTLDPSKAQGLGRAYRTRSVHDDRRTEPRTRAEEAADVFDGFMSSDSEDNDKSEAWPLQDRKMSADRTDQHTSADGATDSWSFIGAAASSGRNRGKTTEGDLALTVLAVDEQAIKKECGTHPPPFLEQSERQPSSKSLVIVLEAEYVPNSENKAYNLMANIRGSCTGTCKRANSAPPITSTSITKRPRIMDENMDRSMRSCSSAVME